MTIPIIDIAPLLSRKPEAEQTVAGAIGRACRTIGFFYVVGHGISRDVMSGVFRESAGFFAAPDHVKQQAAWAGADSNRGYIPVGGESLDPALPPDLKETFQIGLELSPDDPDLLAGKPFRALNQWPPLPTFRPVMLDYFQRVRALGMTLHRAFALDLGLAVDYFEDKFRKPMATLRLLHYPAAHPALGARQKGAGEHTDYGNVTLLATDDAGGLMVKDRMGRWLEAPIVPGAFVCNIGDCLMQWTNDVYVSTPHKVETPPGRERYSVAFFLDPDPDAVVACLPTVLEAGETPRYPPITAGEHLAYKLARTYAHLPSVGRG